MFRFICLFLTCLVLLPFSASAQESVKAQEPVSAQEPAPASGDENSHMNRTAMLMKKSGLSAKVEQMADSVVNRMAHVQAKENRLEPDRFAELKKKSAATFHPEVLKGRVLERLEEGLTDEDLDAVLAWLDSPAGKAVAGLERLSSAPVATNRLSAIENEMKSTESGRRRVSQLERLDKAIMESAWEVDKIIDVEMAVGLIFADALAPSDSEFLEETRKRVEAKRTELKRSVEEEVRLFSLYKYQFLKRSEIEEYINFAESDSGKKFYSLSLKATADVFADAAIGKEKTSPEMAEEPAMEQEQEPGKENIVEPGKEDNQKAAEVQAEEPSEKSPEAPGKNMEKIL